MHRVTLEPNTLFWGKCRVVAMEGVLYMGKCGTRVPGWTEERRTLEVQETAVMVQALAKDSGR